MERVSWLREHFFLVAIAATLFVLALSGLIRPSRKRSRFITLLHRLACRRLLVSAGIAALVLAIRAAALPVWEIPKPAVLDEFSYILLGDTFASGRATNPPHPFWEHFETMFVLQQPTYASVYPPAQGIALAAGQRLAGHPWWGVWLSCGFMCIAFGWMFQGWLPPFWAMFATAWAGLQLGLISYWMNSYWGGALSAAGGALLLGAAVRLVRRSNIVDSAILGLSLVLLANSRPYEGFVLGAAITLWVAWRVRSRLQTLVPAAIVLAAGATLTSWYFWRVTGNPIRMPAREYMLQYAASPMFVWQTIPPEPAYLDTVLREAHLAFRFDREQFLTVRGALRYSVWKLLRIGTFYLGPLILLPVLMMPFLCRGRWRTLLIAIAVTLAAVLVVVPMQLHYAAPLTAAFYALAIQSIRLLWIAGVRGNPLGQFLSAGAPAAVIVVLSLAFVTEPPRTLLRQRAEVEEALVRSGGQHLVIVRYGQFHNLAEEWVYNAAGIDRSPVVWARDKGARNRNLIGYYPDRKVWLLEADTRPVILTTYIE